MFEYNNQQLSMEALQQGAVDAGMDFDEYFNRLTALGMVEKQEEVVEESNLVSDTEDYSFELPQVTMKDVDVPEVQAINRFKKKFAGLGFDFEKAMSTATFGIGQDKVVIIAPPEYEGQPEEDRPRIEVQTDLDLFGFSTYSDRLWGASSKQTAQDINDFVKKYAQGSPVNPETYAAAWNIADTYEVKDNEGKIKKIKDLTSIELAEHMKSAYSSILYSQKMPGIKEVFEEINVKLENFTKTTISDLKSKYDLTDSKQVELANKELTELITKKQDELFNQNQAIKDIQEGVFKAVESKFDGILSDKLRKEAEDAHLPSWITSFDSDIIRQGYITAAIKFPKAYKEVNILHKGIDLKKAVEELASIKDLDPNARNTSRSKDLTYGEAPGVVETNADRIKQLESNIFELNKDIAFNLAGQQEYQQKLEDVRVPTIFGRDIYDPDLTLDEWQGMLGDQAVQMISAILTMGGSTYIQEGGGAALDIIGIEAARKAYPKLGDKEALEAFHSLPTEDTFTDDGVKQKGRASLMADILNKGEANLMPAVTVGAINAGLDLVSNFFVIGKATKFAPKSLGRDLLRRRLGDFLKGGYKSVGKDLTKASLMEFVTETTQEGTSITGVGISTGYYGNKDANIKRLAEAGGQAILATGPLVGTGKVTTTTIKELRARTGIFWGTDIKATRNAIDQIKKEYNKHYEDGTITIDERDQIYTELEAQEDFVNNTKYKNLSNDEKIKVIDNLVEMSNQKKDLNKFQEENKKIKKEEGVTEGINPSTIQNDIKSEVIRNKIRELNNNNLKELWKNDLTTNLEFAEWINNQTEGFFADKAVMTFDKVEDAKNFIEGNNLEKETGKNPLEVAFNLEMLYSGKVNGANLGNIAIIVNDNVKANIDNLYGDWSSSNVVHHETFHFILDAIPVSKLQAVRNQVMSELEASTDPKIKATIKLHKDRMSQYTGDKRTRTYNEEWFTVLSDAMRGVKNFDINLENGVALDGVGKVFGGLFQGVTKKGFDFTKFDAQNALEFIKKYNDFTGKSSGLVLPGIKGKVDVQPPKKKGVTFKLSKAASDNVQRVYEEQGVAGAMDIIGEFKPIISRIAERRREAPGFDKELLMSEIEIGERGILDLIKEYRPESGVPLAAYINKYLPARAIEASRRVLGEEFTEDITERVDIAAEEVEIEVETKPKKKKIVLADRLGVTKEVAKAIDKIVPDLNIDKLNFKTLKNKIPEIVGELFGISPKKLISGANITKKELQSAQMFINKNADLLIVMLPEGATVSGTATGVPQTLLKAFYTKTDRAKMAKTGTKAGLAIQQKNKINKTDFLETFGIIDGKPVRTDRNTSARVLAIANVTGKMITNQAVRQKIGEGDVNVKETVNKLKDGKSKVMFSKSSELLSSYQLGELSKKLGIELTPLIYIQKEGKDKVYTSQRDIDAPFKINNKETGETYKEAATRGLNAFLETNPQFRDLIQKTMTGGVLRAGFFQTVFEFNKVINGTIVEQRTYTKDPYNKNKFLDKNFVKKTKQKEYKAEQDGKLPLLLDFFLAVENHLKNNPSDIWIFEEMLKDTGKHQNTLTRILAPITAYPIDKKRNAIYDQVVVEEHTNPQNQIGKSLLGAAQIGKTQEMWKAIGKSYMQLSLLKTDDNLINDSGYQTSMPDIYYDRIVPRLLDGSLKLPDGLVSVVRLAKSGIDLNNYYLINEGKTIAEFFGVDKMEISIANDQIVKQLTGEIDIKFSKSLNKVNLKPQLKENKILSQAIAFSRSAKNPTKGMSAWDLDDTLARTKSGVRTRIPNPEGTPKPGRKVIFLAGGAGSGKSNVVKQLGLQDQGFKVVNSDISLEWLKKNHGLPTDMKDLTSEQLSQLGKLQYQARQIALNKKMKYQGQGDGVVIDGTGGSLNVMKKQVQEFKDKGYDVQMVFVETSLDVALERNKARKERSLKEGIVKKNHEAVQGNKEGFKELFGDNFAEVNTNNLKQNDPMPSSLVTRVDKFTMSYENRRLTAEEFATEGADIIEQGGDFNFSEFDEIIEGEQGPLFGKAMDRAKKYGLKDQFILTARPHAAKQAIYEFLKSQGLNIPLANIITLENSTSEAKALWIADKVGEGYNDIYFADDALQNVQAVDNMLEQFDVKRKVQQAKRERVEGEKVKSKEESIKSELGDVNNLGSSDNYGNIKFSKSHRAEYENTIAKYRPDLVKDKLVSKTIDNMFVFIDSLNIPSNQKRKYERITTKWLATSNIKLLEDRFKITDAINLAERFKLDLFSYNNPNEIIEAYAGKVKKKVLEPNKVKEFSPGVVFNEKHDITVHEVEDTREGMQSVRDIVSSHWGQNSNPWCITQARNGKLTDDAWSNWMAYRKTKKQIIFQGGKLLGFYANGMFWDRMDNATDAPVITVKDGRVTKKVELVPIGKDKVEEFVRETRTVSKDKKTVTTEILEDSQDGYDAGTKIVEDRVNGITVKSTRYGENGNVSEIIYSDKSGNTISNITFTTAGNTVAINRYGTPFGDMSVHDIVMNKGDLLSHETNEGGFDYYHGDILLNGKRTEIGWQVKEGTFDLKNAIKTVDGKVRADLNKILEVDPNAKGLPKTGIKFSKSMNTEFNDILEELTGIEAGKRFAATKARKRGSSKGKFRVFIPPSHEDFVGLLYNFMGRGKRGNQHRDFFEETLVKPINRANRELDTARQSTANDYKSLNKQFPNVKKKLTKKTPDGDFNYSDVIRIYLWDKHGYIAPGLSVTDQRELAELVMADPELQAYAETLNVISKREDYVNPTEGWESGDIRMDLDDATGRIGRDEYFAEFNENANEIFSEENLNKIEAGYGKGVREALEDMLYRIKTGKNRPSGQNAIVNRFMNYLNGSVGSVMFLNMRSALLQQMSIVNYINFADNNVFAAAKAFANQKQYWNDWAFIFNSDMLKQRRAGIRTDVNGAELAETLRKSKFTSRALISKLLELGFLPTQIGDNVAIATGGAAYYRNRINSYLKRGLNKKEAEAAAFTDLQNITQSTQQSARPDMVSQQQASPIGKVILNFQNVTSQFNRLGKKAFLDIYNRRISPEYKNASKPQLQSDISNASRIAYYFAIQNLIFYSLQTALFAALFSDDEEDEEFFTKKSERLINGSIDSVLRGSGVMGAVIATLKNMAFKFAAQRDKKGFNKDESSVVMEMLNVSPVVGIKARKVTNAEKTLNYNKKVIEEMETFDIDNPVWSATTNYIEATTNAPVNRLYNKTQNVRQALDNQNTAWERVLMFLGWSQYNLGIENQEIEQIKIDIKKQKELEKEQKKLEKKRQTDPNKREIKKRETKKRKTVYR